MVTASYMVEAGRSTFFFVGRRELFRVVCETLASTFEDLFCFFDGYDSVSVSFG